jgi:DNA polymerase
MSETPKLVGLRIDIETKSRTDIKFGAYRYTEDPDFGVLIIAYSPLRQYDDGTVRPGQPRPLNLDQPSDVKHFTRLILDPSFQKHAFNANFERIGLSRWLGMGNGEYIDPENWRCSAVRANANGIFGTLDDVAQAVRSPIKKDPEGKRLIRLFSIPDRKDGRFHKPMGQCWCGADHRDDFIKYRLYCVQDVTTEAVVAAAMPEFPETVQAEYEADQRINDRGFRHHRKLSEQAVVQVAAQKDRVMDQLRVLTGVDNPNSQQQMTAWLAEQGYPMSSLNKASREEALGDPFVPEQVAEALTLKGQASLTSVAKHKAALDTRCADGRIRGSLRFYGAHTGREAGRGIQPQNLPRYEAPEVDRHRLLRGLAGTDAPQIAKGTVRASIVPARNHVFVTADYNAIEARVLGGLAGEKWVEAEFVTGPGKIYEATAARMFGVDKDALVESIRRCRKCGGCPDCLLRGQGKVSELALGYAGGAGALVTMGAEDAGIDIGNYAELNAEWKASGSGLKFHEWEKDRHDYPELIRLRDRYRDARPETVRFWKLCAKAWDIAASGKGARFGQDQCIAMIRDGKHNRMVLPSGRSIWYRFARAHQDPERPERIDRRTFIGKGMGVGHMRTDTHGGKLTENVTQAVARDLLFDLIMRIEEQTRAGWPAKTVLHVHDEVVLEVPQQHADQVLADVLGMMSVSPSWGSIFPLKGEGNIMERYGK